MSIGEDSGCGWLVIWGRISGGRSGGEEDFEGDDWGMLVGCWVSCEKG